MKRKRLRVVALMHPSTVPPDNPDDYSERQAYEWKTEFDVMKTLKKLVRWAENDAKTPDKLKKLRWNQETWATKEKLEPKARCQTACCIAGGAVALAGARFLYDTKELN